MTIKELEQILEVPRATIRYYEKEGLINPQRSDNGYRDYSDNDMEQLKKIIIFRKLGIAVNDIEDLFDGAKSLEVVLGENIHKMQKQMEELAGAMNLSRKMIDNKEEIATFNTTNYWNYVEEEEKKGHLFFDIAKDLVEEEKKVLTGFFDWTDGEGNFYSFSENLIKTTIVVFIFGLTYCVVHRVEVNAKNLLMGCAAMSTFIVIECVLAIPIYFLGKKYPWVKNNRELALIIMCVILAAVLFVVAGFLPE